MPDIGPSASNEIVIAIPAVDFIVTFMPLQLTRVDGGPYLLASSVERGSVIARPAQYLVVSTVAANVVTSIATENVVSACAIVGWVPSPPT